MKDREALQNHRNKFSGAVNRQIYGRHSLTSQVTLAMIALVAGTVMLCLILNTLFLGRFYIWNKAKILSTSYQKINAAAQTDSLYSEEFDIEFERMCVNNNLTIMIINPDRRTIVRSSVNDTQTMLKYFLELLISISDMNDIEDASLIRSGEDFVIQKQTDRRMESDYLVMWGTLSDGKMVIARSALESIHESSNLTNRFLFMIGGIAVIIGAIVAGIVTQRITNPILELTELSKRMTELDFDAKYTVSRKYQNEIDFLGEHMNEMSSKLEHTISELKSANNELMLDNEKKTQVDEMRKEFLSNVSHELKTPLALIQGYAEGLQECIHDDAESRDFYCDVIMDEADKMNQMVKKLLTLNHLEFGDEAVSIERFDLTELVAGVINASSILIRQNEITVHFDSSRPMYVWADEFKIEEVITNFLSNAIHYALYEKRIDVFYTVKEDCVRLSVFNTGEPIPQNDLDKVWIKFYKVDKARTREYGGSGIGLSIVKAIMDSMNRQCGVFNRDGGVEFWMELDTGMPLLSTPQPKEAVLK